MDDRRNGDRFIERRKHRSRKRSSRRSQRKSRSTRDKPRQRNKYHLENEHDESCEGSKRKLPERRERKRRRERGNDYDSRYSTHETLENLCHKEDDDNGIFCPPSSPSSSSFFSSSSSITSSPERENRHQLKKVQKKERKKHRSNKRSRKRGNKKDSKHERKESELRHSGLPSRNCLPDDSYPPPTATPAAQSLASALIALFSSYPSMCSLEKGGIPLLLHELGCGTAYDLSQMPDRKLAQLLENVWKSLQVYGMKMRNRTWRWDNASDNNLALLLLVRALMDDLGLTMEAVVNYEHQEESKSEESDCCEPFKHAPEMNLSSEADKMHHQQKKRVERMTYQLLNRSDILSPPLSASLATELLEVCKILKERRSVQLNGIKNEKLRASLEQLFQLVGLELVEIEDGCKNDINEGAKGGSKTDESNEIVTFLNHVDKSCRYSPCKSLGYALPEEHENFDFTISNLNEVFRVCLFQCGEEKSGKATRPIFPVLKPNADSSSSEDEGPTPMANGQAYKSFTQQGAPLCQSLGLFTRESDVKNEREEWMMNPGEHTFLERVSSSTRARAFKNEKNLGQPKTPQISEGNCSVSPNIQSEVNAIKKAYEESRGPSLTETFRRQQKQEEQHSSDSCGWKWNREKNLDDGRRVDTKALHLLMGGAKTELKSKFHGSDGS